MSGSKEYEKDFERLMAPLEEKADRMADRNARRFLEDLKERATAVGIKWSEVLKRFESDHSLDGIIAEIKSRQRSMKTSN